MKVFNNIEVTGYNNKPVNVQINEKGDTRILTWVEAFQFILNNAPLKTQQDSINGMRLQLALDKAKENGNNIEIEEGVHDWLKPIAEQFTPLIFRVNGNIIYEHIKEGFDKTGQSR